VTSSAVLHVAFHVVCGLLALYHLLMGAAALFAPRSAPALMRRLYGASIGDTDVVRYMTSMIGALALAIGGLAAVAAVSPVANRPIVAALLVLQLGRLFCRIRDRRLLAASLAVTPRANAAAIAVLAIEAAVLALVLT
jgi:hypothetical protein